MSEVGRGRTMSQVGDHGGGLHAYFRAIAAVLWKDVRIHMRNPESLIVMSVFSFVCLLIYDVAFNLQEAVSADLGAGILWVTLAFAGILGFNRIMAGEREQGCLDGLLLVPVDRSAIFFGKWISGLLHMLIVSVLLIPIFSAFFSLALLQWEMAWIVVLLSAGYAALGTLLAAMTLRAGAREILLPVLLLPPAFPLLLAAIQATRAVLLGYEGMQLMTWIRLLVACDSIYLALAWMMYDRLLTE